MLLLVLAAAAAAGGALVRVVSLPEAAGRWILLLLLLDATTDLPPPLLLDVADADEAAVDAAAGVGVFFEKKENRFFCLEVAMVHCYLFAEIGILLLLPNQNNDSTKYLQYSTVARSSKSKVYETRERAKKCHKVKKSGAKWREKEKWNELAGSKSGAGGPVDAPIFDLTSRFWREEKYVFFRHHGRQTHACHMPRLAFT